MYSSRTGANNPFRTKFWCQQKDLHFAHLMKDSKKPLKLYDYTVELQWLEHLWDHRKLFEAWVVRATEGLIMVPGQGANRDNLGIFFLYFLHNDCMLSVLIRIASMRQF